MRLTSAVVGGLGAVLGVLKGLLFGAAAFSLMVRQGDRGLNVYNLLEISAQVALAASCLLGVVGAGLVLGGGRLRAGTLMLLASAACVAVIAVSYGLLVPLTQPPDYRAVTGPLVMFTQWIFYVLSLFPVPFLLVGAALAFFTSHQRGEAESAAS